MSFSSVRGWSMSDFRSHCLSKVARDKRTREVRVFVFHKTLITSQKINQGSIWLWGRTHLICIILYAGLLSHISHIFSGKSSPTTVGDGHNNLWFLWIIGRTHSSKRHPKKNTTTASYCQNLETTFNRQYKDGQLRGCKTYWCKQSEYTLWLKMSATLYLRVITLICPSF